MEQLTRAENELNSLEMSQLTECEAVIERGLKTFYEVGEALATIRDERLYRATHNTFEDYCRDKWGISDSRARQLVLASQTVNQLQQSQSQSQSVTNVTVLPANEGQVRPLMSLPQDQRAAAWERAVATAPEGKVTGAHVKQVVNAEFREMPEPEVEPSLPQHPHDSYPQPDGERDSEGCLSVPAGMFRAGSYLSFGSPVYNEFDKTECLKCEHHVRAVYGDGEKSLPLCTNPSKFMEKVKAHTLKLAEEKARAETDKLIKMIEANANATGAAAVKPEQAATAARTSTEPGEYKKARYDGPSYDPDQRVKQYEQARARQLAQIEAEKQAQTQQQSQPMQVLTSHARDDWGTPEAYAEAARLVLGGQIDLDPASNPEANKVVKAARFFTKEQDGLIQCWANLDDSPSKVYGNFPFGGVQALFVKKLVEEFEAGNVSEAIILVNLYYGYEWFAPLRSRPMCLVDHRIAFRHPDTGEEGDEAKASSVFVYFGKEPHKFYRVFSQFGYCCKPEKWS